MGWAGGSAVCFGVCGFREHRGAVIHLPRRAVSTEGHVRAGVGGGAPCGEAGVALGGTASHVPPGGAGNEDLDTDVASPLWVCSPRQDVPPPRGDCLCEVRLSGGRYRSVRKLLLCSGRSSTATRGGSLTPPSTADGHGGGEREEASGQATCVTSASGATQVADPPTA